MYIGWNNCYAHFRVTVHGMVNHPGHTLRTFATLLYLHCFCHFKLLFVIGSVGRRAAIFYVNRPMLQMIMETRFYWLTESKLTYYSSFLAMQSPSILWNLRVLIISFEISIGYSLVKIPYEISIGYFWVLIIWNLYWLLTC